MGCTSSSEEPLVSQPAPPQDITINANNTVYTQQHTTQMQYQAPMMQMPPPQQAYMYQPMPQVMQPMEMPPPPVEEPQPEEENLVDMTCPNFERYLGQIGSDAHRNRWATLEPMKIPASIDQHSFAQSTLHTSKNNYLSTFFVGVPDENGVPQGYGLTIWFYERYLSGKQVLGLTVYQGTHEQTTKTGKITGKGRMIYNDGSLFVGRFQDGIPVGQSEFKSFDDSTHHTGLFESGSMVAEPVYKGEPLTEEVRLGILQARWDYNEELWKEHLSVKYKQAMKDSMQEMLFHQHWNIRQKSLDEREMNDLQRIENELVKYKEDLGTQQQEKAAIDAEKAALQEEIDLREIEYGENWHVKREGERENERQVELKEDWGNAEELTPALELADNDDEEGLKDYKAYPCASKYKWMDLPPNDPIGLHESEEFPIDLVKWFIIIINKGLLVEMFTFDEMKAQLYKVVSDYQVEGTNDDQLTALFTKLDQDGDGYVAGGDFAAIREWLGMRRDPKMALFDKYGYPLFWTRIQKGFVPDNEDATIKSRGFFLSKIYWKNKLEAPKSWLGRLKWENNIENKDEKVAFCKKWTSNICSCAAGKGQEESGFRGDRAKLYRMFQEGYEPTEEEQARFDELEYLKIACTFCHTEIEAGAGFWFGKSSARGDPNQIIKCASCAQAPQAQFPGFEQVVEEEEMGME